MKTFRVYLLFTSAIFIFLVSTAYVVQKNLKVKLFNPVPVQVENNNDKIIKFDHSFHINEADVACEDCHTKAKNSLSAKDNLNPVKADCATCHDVNDQNTCNMCHFDNVYKKLESSRKELIFSHNFHLETENMQCTDCHKGLDKIKYAKQSAAAFPPMETCYSCHDNKKAMNNCEGCHTNLTSLIPKDHEKTNFLNEHKLVFGISAEKNCMMCHSDNFCQVCHSPVKYSGNNTKENFNVPYYTKESGTRTDRGKLQKLTTVHTLNYKFTHGLDANQKSFECKTCHDPVDFCSSCHQNKGDLITGFLPKSHQQMNFVTLGVNTGGGLHADLARKDIESCQSCHDVEGRDPACIKCHYDNDGIKGTNPRTHEPGFLRDENGIWHNTQGAVCYTCHTDANARPNGISGIGFCGYCHGRVNQR
jgi:c(7)-type cytochrome triheme protein